ncbi:sulfatase [Mangrovimonas sp. AS39]|uniref:sulfatase family protein n=1 Tax=Mangrovimonas futianensis TaxID=2895523 RepID=UPI001E309C52|nr:sulfatase [Mangrovimonas futianensis]MCF1191048.1 sulfatase [Mangrovimonas futianensis]MCF1194743.1 sulfatase [Mangrovimonas futianensis]
MSTLIVLFMGCKDKGTNETAKAEDLGMTKERPNIIYIMADDLTTQAISAYGGIYSEIAPTPNIDRLANEGMLFQNVMCTNAICGPSRAAILTGDYSNLNGYYKNESGGKFDETKWTFPQEFQKNGYQTSLFGKWHLGSDPQGFDVFKYHNSAGQQGHYWDPIYNENGKDVKEKGYSTNLSTDFALDWLQKGRKQEEPFMMILQYKAPHRPWEPDTKYKDLWDDIEMPYPSTFNDDYKGRELTAGDTEMTMDYFSRRDMKLEEPEGLDRKEKLEWAFYGASSGEVVQPEGMSEEDGRKWRYQTYIKDYLACVKSVDDNIGRVLKYLDDNNLTENTVIVLTSDQGFYLGDHGFFDKRFIYEESLRMPFIMKYPGMIKSGSQNKDIITNIDFASTFLDIANIQSNHKTQGTSFKPLLDGTTPDDWQQAMYYHYYEFPYWHHVQPHYGIRTQRFTLAHFYYNIDVWELYDLEKDPEQLNNVYNDPQYASVITDLKGQLNGLKKKYGNDKSLEELREITNKDFGLIVDKEDDETSVRDILNK